MPPLSADRSTATAPSRTPDARAKGPPTAAPARRPNFAALLRRISLLATFHADAPLEADFAGLSRAGWTVRHRAARRRWHEWVRYSSRQDALLQMGGLVGIELDGVGLEQFWPYLWLGQWTDAGKGAVMGLGRYRLTVD